MDEGSLRVVTKLASFIVYLFLWQLSFGSFFKSTAQVMSRYNYDGRGLVCLPTGSTYTRGLIKSLSVPTYPVLPDDEVTALSTVVQMLPMERPPCITPSFCVRRGNSDSASVIIGCDCTYKSKSVCHIIEVNMVDVGLTGDEILGAVSKLTYLQTLNLGSNKLTGKIPESLGNLQYLTTLYLNKNFLIGSIQPSLGNLSSLTHMSLRNNKLEDRIPDELGNLRNLEYLRLDDNQLSGSLPPALGNLINLQYLWLTSNKFTGDLPDYSNLTNLLSFAVTGNYLSGRIPSYFENWIHLTELNLLGNNFEGELPPEIFDMENLEYLWVSDLSNKGFPFPASAKLTNIQVLILRNCSINGSIPSYIGQWKNLRYIDLSFNKLSGGIPNSLQNLKLTKMILTRNMLNGTIAPWIPKNVQAEDDLSYNNFTIETFPGPRKIYLEPNRTSIYQMRDEHCDKRKSKYRSLFINCGGEETTIGGDQYDRDNDTSNFFVSPKKNWAYSTSGSSMFQLNDSSDYIKNVTCGVSVPEAQLYEDARLAPHSLAYYGFCLHNGKYVTLHFAEIVYANDEDYSSLGKRVFDVYIQGNRVLQDFNIKEKAGGPKKRWVENLTADVQDNILEIHFYWAGKGSIFNPPQLNGPLISAISVTPVGSRNLSAGQIAAIAVGSVFALLLLLALLWRMGLVGNKELYEKKIEIRGQRYSLKQLIVATRKFNPKMEIGKGQFGIVYKAELPVQGQGQGQTVAVKKLSAHSKQVINQIGTEVYALKSLKHENLVELLASYSGKGLHLVIYEYMEHDSLKKTLFDSPSSEVLTWEVRYNICLGVAEGLKYLHEKTPRVIHRNIKATNVLLDGAFKAKISEFGLAKLYEEENPFLVIGEDEALLYMAPEYATRRAVSDKVDVYSFGVLVLEIVSGRNNAEYIEKQETVFLVDAACVSHTKGRLLDLVDRKLSSNYHRGQAITVLNLAMMCIDQSPTLRPTISEVVDVLEGNKTIEQISKVATPSA